VLSRRRVLTLLALLSCGAEARAQSAVSLRAARADAVTIDAGDVVTSAFIARNVGPDTARVRLRLEVPRGWSALAAGDPMKVAPAGKELILASVSTPHSTAAGRYLIRAGLDVGAMDSLVVIVRARRGMDVLPLDVPGWVLAGAPFSVRFLVRNRGNLTAHVRLDGWSVQGVRCRTEPDAAVLEPGATVVVSVIGVATASLVRTVDDLVELRANERDDATVRAAAASRTTFVPRNASGPDLATVPVQLVLRAAGAPSGVSPIVAEGGGLLADGRTSVAFSATAATNRRSQFGFGDAESYRLLVQNDRWHIRLGDHGYGLSPLLTDGLVGVGAEAGVQTPALDAAVYAERPRWMPTPATEIGARLGMPAAWPVRLYGAGLTRLGADREAVRVGAFGVDAPLPLNGALGLEAARSDSGGTPGIAGRLHAVGRSDAWSYSLNALRADPGFAGRLRGATTADASVEAHPMSRLTLSLSASGRDWRPPLLPNAPFDQRFSNVTATAAWAGVLSLEYGTLNRRDRTNDSITVDGVQRSLRASTSLRWRGLGATVSAERGIVDDAMTRLHSDYTMLSVSLRADLGAAGVLSAYGTRSSGRTLSSGASGVLSSGANLQLHFPWSMEVFLSASAQRASLGDYDGSGAWLGQADARIDHRFTSGATLGLRAHALQRAAVFGTPNARGLFVEYRVPLRMPTGPSRERGRAVGVVLDAATGQPFAGALVRLGNEAAVTDAHGRVSFRGLAAAVHRVELNATRPAAGALLVGDVEVDTRAGGDKPVQFSVAVARGAEVRAIVRLFDFAGTTVSTRGDSIVDAGVMPNVLVALEGARDTLWQASDERGRLDFGRVPPGNWVLRVRSGDVPEHHAFAVERMALDVRPGEQLNVELRLLPQRRTVTFVGESVELRARRMPGNDKK